MTEFMMAHPDYTGLSLLILAIGIATFLGGLGVGISKWGERK